MDEHPDSAEMVIELFRERQGFANQARDRLRHGVVKALDVVGLTAVFADIVQCLGIEDGVISFPEVHIRFSVQVALRYAVPEGDCTGFVS